MPNELITWADLGTFSILVLLTYIIVNFTKDVVDSFGRFNNIGTFRFGVLVAFVLQLLYLVGSGDLSYQGIVLAVLNAFIIELAAGKLNDSALESKAKKESMNKNL